MAGMRPESQGFSDPFLPPVCFIFLPDLLTIEQSPPGPLGTRLLQPQVKQLAFPAWSKRESVQVQVRRWCTQLQSRWNVVCDTLRDFSTAHVSCLEAGCLLTPAASGMLEMMMCVERSVQLQT